MLALMRSGLYVNIDFVPLRQAPQKAYADAQAFIRITLGPHTNIAVDVGGQGRAYESGGTAMWDSRCELDVNDVVIQDGDLRS
jgi:hypothetical protein